MKLLTVTEHQMQRPWWMCHSKTMRTDYKRCGIYWICDICKRVIMPWDAVYTNTSETTADI